ncbi:hypothetical protein MHC_03195 [Mycoplasma haemocanis str. Illinois]|uniref:Uncharacterized protein n=1 Tax=Mycoplasma haemocanis (strain Illinois) TaxID=1111676 RepID=H6N777_MYCHN|nr:hypothetical protein [Mycoplasma haemocanis]AEW45499.1 hypothetical protein MHC_03195 [Mycoplasma haemocanis str. Illinois]
MEAWKLGASLFGVGGAIGGGYLVYPYASPEDKRTILDELKSKDKSPITDNESQWTLKKTLYDKSPNNYKISVQGIEKSSITVSELKEWCSNNMKETYSPNKNDILSKVEKWCLKPDIKEALSKETGGLIPFDEKPNNSAWSSKISSQNGSIQEDLINKWKLNHTTGSPNTVSPEVLSAACKEKIKGEYISDADENYTLSKKWCLK